MTGTQLAALIHKKTRTNSTTFSLADMLVDVNIFKDEIASMIVEKNAGFFLVPATFNLVANQREYAIGDDMLSRLHKVEIKFASTDSRFPASYVKDYLGSETESEIVKNYSNSRDGFAYCIRRRALFLLSGTIIAVTDGIRIWYHIFPGTLANLTGSTGLEVDPTTTSFGFPRQFHELLARRVSMEYKGRQPRPIPLNDMEKRYDIDLERQLAAISHVDNSGEILAEFPDPSVSGNDGWDY